MPRDAEARLEYVDAVVQRLWPVGDHNGARPNMVVLPCMRYPRLLVPRTPGRAAASSLLRYTAQQGLRDRMVTLGVVGGVGVGLCRILPALATATHGVDGETIDDRLGEVLEQDVITTLAITPYRPNRKPVLQVFDTQGRTLAFAKIGIGELPRRLVDAEAAALRLVGQRRVPNLDVPRVLAHTEWRDTVILLLSPLPRGSPVRSARDIGSAMQGVAAIGQEAHGRVEDYLARLRRRAAHAAGTVPGAILDEWRQLLDDVTSSPALETISLAAWHGDWTPWNCSRRRDTVMTWDWERFARAVPFGFDALHFQLNRDVGKRWNHPRAAAWGILTRAPQLLAGWRVEPRTAELTAQLYLLDIGLRFLADAPHGTTKGSRLAEWVFPAVHASLDAASGKRVRP